MFKFIKYFFIILFSYLFVQAALTLFFSKEDTTETILVKISSKKVENIDVGWGDARPTKRGFLTSTYKYVYELDVLKRDGWIGNIKYIYSDLELEVGKVYGLEVRMIETTSNLQYWFVPSIWSDYAFHILTVYNFRKEMANTNFQSNNHDLIYDKIKNTYNMFNRISDQTWSDETYKQE